MSSLNLTSPIHMSLTKWDVFVDEQQILHIKIAEDIDINNLKFTLISDVRLPIFTIPITGHTMDFDSSNELPMFGQLGDSVKYVTGSGKKSYN